MRGERNREEIDRETKTIQRQLAADFQKITVIERECVQKLRDTDREANKIIQVFIIYFFVFLSALS